MSPLDYTKAERIRLKGHPEFSESWLQERIAEDPGILGLGDLMLLDRERPQPKAGRLDLLLGDTDEDRRFEVELMLGATDESHIIRCIEYWDIEKRRYPHYDHCAVLVAEDLTSRFLNVLGLFNGQIPMIVIQLNALKVGEQIVLDFVRVMDRFDLRRDEETDIALATTDRDYWNTCASVATVKIADEVLLIINENADPAQSLNYNKSYIGLNDGTRSRNFMHFKPKKQFLHFFARVKKIEHWVQQLEEAGLSATAKKTSVQLTIRPAEFEQHRELLTELIHQAVKEYQA